MLRLLTLNDGIGHATTEGKTMLAIATSSLDGGVLRSPHYARNAA
jgi:hypothetical protein